MKDWIIVSFIWGFPGGTGDKEPTCQYRRRKEHRFDLVEDPLEEGMATHPNSVQTVIEGPPPAWNGITGGDYCLISLARILSSVPTSD